MEMAGVIMASETVVNLVGVLSPLCLMKTKKMLLELNPGDQIHVVLKDSEVINDLKKIIDCSADEIVQFKKVQNYYLISIQKG
jgi:TusA-related sulfurtransferase